MSHPLLHHRFGSNIDYKKPYTEFKKMSIQDFIFIDENLIGQKNDTYPISETSIECTHSINSDFFRGPEIDQSKPTVIYLGCSFTEGTGLKYEHTWPYLVHDTLYGNNYQLINAGIQAGNIQICLSSLLHIISKYPDLKIQAVYGLFPSFKRRFLLLNNSQYIRYSKGNIYFNDYKSKNDSMLLDNNYDYNNLISLNLSTLELLNLILKRNNISFKWHMWDHEDIDIINKDNSLISQELLKNKLNINHYISQKSEICKKFHLPNYEWAADYMHFGPWIQGMYAYDFIQEVNNT